MDASLFYKYSGEFNSFFFDAEDRLIERKVSDFHNLDFTLSKEFMKKKVMWAAGIKNIFDVQDLTTVGRSTDIHTNSSGSVSNSWGRSVFTSLKINLNKR